MGPFDSRRERSPQTVTPNVSTGASKKMYQARPRIVAFSKNIVTASVGVSVHPPRMKTPPGAVSRRTGPPQVKVSISMISDTQSDFFTPYNLN